LSSVSIHFEQPIDGANRLADENDMTDLHTRLESKGANVRLTSSHEASQPAGKWMVKELAPNTN
jgi:hypothetical protein